MHPYDKLSHPDPLTRLKSIRSRIDEEEREYMEQQAHLVERLSVDFSALSLEQLTAFIEDPENGFDQVGVFYGRDRSFVDGSHERGRWIIDGDISDGVTAPTFRDALEKFLFGHRDKVLLFLDQDLGEMESQQEESNDVRRLQE